MDSTKLMVNDKLIHDNKVVTVDEVYRDGACAIDKDRHDHTIPKEFDSTKITREILELNEFARLESNGKPNAPSGIQAEIYRKNVDYLNSTIRVGFDYGDYFWISIDNELGKLAIHHQQYSHDLQHALRIMGLDEEANKLRLR